jgi:hypothetical protein
MLAALLMTTALFGAFPKDLPKKEVSAAGVKFQWVIQSNTLHGCIDAVTTGWITVGFNARRDLAGTRLVMGRVVNGIAHAEVHIAKPPHHIHRLAKDGSERVTAVIGSFKDGRTKICFQMPLKAADMEDVDLSVGQNIYLTLAWSHEADFEHHSARRDAVDIKL